MNHAVRQLVILTIEDRRSVGAVLAVFLTENALMIFGLSSNIFCKLLPGFSVEECEG